MSEQLMGEADASARDEVGVGEAMPKKQSGGRVTITDVARHAGVSHQTVSRYLQFNGGLKSVTVEKIEAAVRELEYQPDLIARSMRTRRSNRIAIVIPELSYFVPGDLRGAMAVAHEAGFLVDVVSLDGSEAHRTERVRALIEGERVEGVLSLAPLGGAVSAWNAASGPPVVVIGQYDDKMHATGAFASGQMASDIVQHLAGLGHRRLLHVAGSDDWASARNRRNVYIETAERLGLDFYAVLDGDWSVRSGYEAARDLDPAAGVTAIFAANDFVALGVASGLRERGVRIPDDVSVVGWDDEEFAQFMGPPLTTVAVNKAAQGRQAMQMLFASVRGEPQPVFDQGVLGRLVVRGSTGPAPA